jgi:hypothetical protein
MNKISEKWNSLMSPGDGGAYFLIEELFAVDWQALKAERLKLNQEDLLKQILVLLEPVVVHDDVNKKIQQEKQNFLKHFKKLQQLLDKRDMATFADLFAIDPLDLKASISSVILSGGEREEVTSQASGIQVPSFLKGEVPEENKNVLQSSKERFFEELISALLVSLLEELDNNIKNCSKSLTTYQDSLSYLASQFTSEYQLEKLRKQLMTLSGSWTTGLKLTDNIEPICMMATRMFDNHFYGVVEGKNVTSSDVIANPTISHFGFEPKPSGNVVFFNTWMNHVGKTIEDNISNVSGGAHDLTLNAQLVVLLEKTQNHLDKIRV